MKSNKVQYEDHKEEISRRNLSLFMNSQFSQKMNMPSFFILYTYLRIICLKSTSLNFIKSCRAFPYEVHNYSLAFTYCIILSAFLHFSL
jgi:hypothetical protein